MNSRERGILRKLVSELDDTRLIYTKLGPLLTSSRLIYLVELITLLHEESAHDLALEMDTLGNPTPRRRASASGRLRAFLETLLAITDVNLDRACLKAVARHEARVVQRFVMTLHEVDGLSQCIYRDQHHLAQALYRIESLMQDLSASAFSSARKALTVAPIQYTQRRDP